MSQTNGGMSSHDQNSPGHVSRVDLPALLYGSVGVALAVAMQAVGLFKKGDERLMNLLVDPVFYGQVPMQMSMLVSVLIAVFVGYGMAFAVLDTAGVWRRWILGVTALILVWAMVPTMAVWQIYFSPFLPSVSIFWAWFCTMMYVSHHVMPCERGAVPPSILSVSSAYKIAPAPEVAESKKDEERVSDEDEVRKYQPKEVNHG